jgi:hypothetical protein
MVQARSWSLNEISGVCGERFLAAKNATLCHHEHVPGDAKRAFKRGYGLSHIIARRAISGESTYIDVETDLREVRSVKGTRSEVLAA